MRDEDERVILVDATDEEIGTAGKLEATSLGIRTDARPSDAVTWTSPPTRSAPPGSRRGRRPARPCF